MRRTLSRASTVLLLSAGVAFAQGTAADAPAAPTGGAASAAVPAPARDDGPVLLVVSDTLDAHASDPRVNEWLGAQVRQFAAALRDRLADRGLTVDLADLSHDGPPAQALDARLHAGARPYRYLAEAHWAANDRHQVAIFARWVPLIRDGETVHEAAASDPRVVTHAWARMGTGAGPDADRPVAELAMVFAAAIDPGHDAPAASASQAAPGAR